MWSTNPVASDLHENKRFEKIFQIYLSISTSFKNSFKKENKTYAADCGRVVGLLKNESIPSSKLSTTISGPVTEFC